MRHEPSIRAANVPAPLPAAAVARLAGLYPLEAGKIAHDLAGHPLLMPAALAEAAQQMDPATVECREARNRNGEGFAFAGAGDSDPAATILDIAKAGRWVMLAKIEQLPEYAALLEDVMDALGPAIRPATGAPLRLQGFVFVSSPGALTPFHMDPEYNILFQIAGRKRFAVCPGEGAWLTDAVNERYHQDGNNLLAWHDTYAAAATVHPLAPGEALFVPYKCAHWVEVESEPSVSLSLTWCSASSFEQEAAWRLNAWLRRRGLSPHRPARLPARNRGMALAWRALDRLGWGSR